MLLLSFAFLSQHEKYTPQDDFRWYIASHLDFMHSKGTMPSRKTTCSPWKRTDVHWTTVHQTEKTAIHQEFTSLKISTKGLPCCWMLRVKQKRSHIHNLCVLMFAFQIHYSPTDFQQSSGILPESLLRYQTALDVTDLITHNSLLQTWRYSFSQYQLKNKQTNTKNNVLLMCKTVSHIALQSHSHADSTWWQQTCHSMYQRSPRRAQSASLEGRTLYSNQN